MTTFDNICILIILAHVPSSDNEIEHTSGKVNEAYQLHSYGDMKILNAIQNFFVGFSVSSSQLISGYSTGDSVGT